MESILIVQGGGPTAVVNRSVAGVVRAARADGFAGRILGAVHGISGVVGGQVVDLTDIPDQRWDRLERTPGAVLGSTRHKVADDEIPVIAGRLREWNVRFLFGIGGNDTMGTALNALRATEEPPRRVTVIGVPKTIDNDLVGNDFCPGFPSAARFTAQAVRDVGADVRSLPTPVSVFEVMGRHAGWLTAATLLARQQDGDPPHAVYVPERPVTVEEVVADAADAVEKHGYAVLVVSEGVTDPNGDPLFLQKNAIKDEFDHVQVGGVAAFLASEIASQAGLRSRSEVPGLIARSAMGCTSAVDDQGATLVGREAWRLAADGDNGVMAGLRVRSTDPVDLVVEPVPLADVAELERRLPDTVFDATTGRLDEPAVRRYAEPLVGPLPFDYDRLRLRGSGTATGA